LTLSIVLGNICWIY